ncbi:hypothetical protein [Tolypothrix sp. PCC 7910]|nr:hypothetical protein [Tolypothrix sp. PCC 7910]
MRQIIGAWQSHALDNIIDGSQTLFDLVLEDNPNEKYHRYI